MKPFKFLHNRVWRAYKGGALIDQMQGVKTPEDGSFPEEWVASCVKAANKSSCPGGNGVSIAETEKGCIAFDELLKDHPEELLGPEHYHKFGPNTGFLAKILDSAIRLPLQAHPDNDAARIIYNSRFGKTEAWIVLGNRKINGEEPYLIIGFNEKLDKELFIKEALEGDMTESLDMVYKHKIKAGDVLMIKGGTVHAIGPGALIYEIMEPTDFVTQPEKYCGTQELTDNDRFGTTDPATALSVFNFTPRIQKDAWNDTLVLPRIIFENENVRVTELINRDAYKYFGAIGVDLQKTWQAKLEHKTFYSGTVTSGQMEIITGDGSLKVREGESFFMPYDAPDAVFSGKAEIILTLPPTI